MLTPARLLFAPAASRRLDDAAPTSRPRSIGPAAPQMGGDAQVLACGRGRRRNEVDSGLQRWLRAPHLGASVRAHDAQLCPDDEKTPLLLRPPVAKGPQALGILGHTRKVLLPRLWWSTTTLFAAPGRNRDFAQYPALHIDASARNIWSVGDPHACIHRLTNLFVANGIMAQEDGAWRWRAGTDALVCTGDLIDKGEDGLAVIHLFRTLAPQAAAQGGAVVVTMGNHEMAFHNNPYGEKAVGPGGIFWELLRNGISPTKMARGKHPDGAFLYNLPIAAIVGDILFAHGGNTAERTREAMQSFWENGIKRDGFGSLAINGENSILRARGWYGHNGEQGPRLARIAQVDAIVYGHDPDTLAPIGKILLFGKDDKSGNKTLVRQDCGMSPGITLGDDSSDLKRPKHGGYSRGELLRIERDGQWRYLSAYDADGQVRKLGKLKAARKEA